MLQDTKLSIHDLFFSKLIAPKNYTAAAPTISSHPTHWLFNRYPFTSSKNLVFPWPSLSRSPHSPIRKFRHILQHGPCNLSSHSHFNKHGFNHFFSSRNHHYHHQKILKKLASYKNSVLRLLDSKRPGSYLALNLYHLVQSPSASIGIAIRSTLKRTPRLLSSLGAVRHYHMYRGLPPAPKDYSKFARFTKHVKENKLRYIVGLGLVTIFAIGSWETVPYSKRTHFVIIPPSKDKSIGDFISRIREERHVLPQDHPDSVRVRSISNKILKALQSDLKIKEMTGLEYSSKCITSNVNEKGVRAPWRRRSRFSTSHLEGLNWEIVVVDMYSKNAYVLPGGKIVVDKYLLKSCKSDAQVAAVIGHEVGHVVARHYAERFTKMLWFTIGIMIILFGAAGSAPPPNPQGTRKLGELILNPCSRRNEKEADYIGLLLMASAGYDPREAPKVYEMLDPDPEDSSDSKFKFIADFFDELFSTHPSGKKRIAALCKPKVMEEAMTRFSKAMEATRREEEEIQCLEGGLDIRGS